jgi:uncharacterized RDD family membrane protein YckC
LKTIDIVTSNNVTIQYELSSIAKRFVGLLLDMVIWWAYLGIVIYVSTLIFVGVTSLAPEQVTWDTWGSTSNNSYWIYLIVAILSLILVTLIYIPVFFYRFLSEYLFSGRTVGKMATGVRVIKVNGEIPSLTDYFLRSSFMLIDYWMSLGSFGFLTSSSSDRNQRIGDMVAGTVVIQVKPSVNYTIHDILSIKTSKNYTPEYPGVTSLTDDDMLLIKNAIERVRKFPNKNHKKLVVDLAQKCQNLLAIEKIPEGGTITFLKTLLQDYIVLTRS